MPLSVAAFTLQGGKNVHSPKAYYLALHYAAKLAKQRIEFTDIKVMKAYAKNGHKTPLKEF